MKIIKQIILEAVGAAVFSLGIGYFTSSVKIAPGGISGIALIINRLTGFPVGTGAFLLNIPILILGFFALNKRLIFHSAVITLITSVMIDFAALIPPFNGERMLGTVFGGILTGGGMGIIFCSGGTTGGIDILSYIIQKKRPSLSIGNAILITDCIVILSSMAVYREAEAGLYGIISLYASTKAIDGVMYGIDGASVILIVTDKPAEISKHILKKLSRGATQVKCSGAYSVKEHTLIICAVRRRQFTSLKKAVSAIDSSAFVISLHSANIYGEGFE